jgi:hypothetical protein
MIRVNQRVKKTDDYRFSCEGADSSAISQWLNDGKEQLDCHARLCLAILNDITNVDVDVASQKRKDRSDESTSCIKKPKSSSMVSVLMYERLKKENAQLKKEIDTYKNNWMRKSLFYILMH